MGREVSTWEVTVNAVNTLTHVMVGFVSVYMCYVAYERGYSNISMHVLLCALGYQLLMAEGILALAPFNVWTIFFTRRTKTIIHWSMQAFGGAFAIIGMAYEYWGRTSHFRSIHSKLGLASFAFLILTMLNGVTNLFSREMRSLVKPVYQRFFHNLMALVTFVLGMAALYYGFEKRTIREYATEEVRWILKIFLCITIVTSSIAALKSGYQQFKDVIGTTRESILPEKS
ncbi:uncharacterized protein LOC119084089 [Bradysia coprophila]|uniref:uncharacterized protein LOC119084089 n=1 Tax=Bradysia coprophila TaxID=38358 RepID=UPI00187D8D4C|nr:uncharacterized protein LOC119084089 [Bradysia coprophila]